MAVLESLFDAGFYLEATYPIRSDETKGEGANHVRLQTDRVRHHPRLPQARPRNRSRVSWATNAAEGPAGRAAAQDILEHHQKAGLQEADLQVIRRGKALEYYSRHYGKVYVDEGREFTVKDALVGINQLLDEEADATAEPPPVDAEPYTRQFLRLFADRSSLPRDQMQKFLRGTGVSPQEFVERGWCEEKQKVFHLVAAAGHGAKHGRARLATAMAADFDQAMFMIGACFEGSGIKRHDTLNNPNFMPHPAHRRHARLAHPSRWRRRRSRTPPARARQLYQTWEAKKQNEGRSSQLSSLLRRAEA